MTVTALPTLDADAWLAGLTAPEPDPDRTPRWKPRGGAAVAVRGLEHLAVLVSVLDEPGDWGVLDVPGGGRWGQTMRHPGGWIVETSDGTPTDYAQRVHRGGPGAYPPPTGPRPAHPCELWTPLGAADVLWAWLHGRLVDGCSRTMHHLVRDGVDHGF